MGIIFTFVFILITIFSLLHLYQVYKNSILVGKKEENNQGLITFKEIGMLVPCYNEEIVLTSAINNFSKLTYPKLKIVFINDGSTDNTLLFLIEQLKLQELKLDKSKLIIKSNEVKALYKSANYNNIFVIDKENGGKADSLNAAINLMDTDYLVTLDADSILKDDALQQINLTLQDEDVIATGGNIITSQGVKNFSGDIINYVAPKRIIETVQFIDYLKGFFITKNSYSHLNALSIISGAFGVFKKSVMTKVGGFTKTVGEDIDITMKFHEYAAIHNKKIIFNDKAICFTEVPNNWRDFFKQRIRWQKGFIDAFKQHRKFLFKNFFSKRVAFFMIFENLLLAYFSIVCMLVGFYYLGFDVIHHIRIGILMYIVLVIGILIYLTYDITIFIMAKQSALKISKSSIPMIVFVLLFEVLIYRQIMIVIYIWGSIEYFFKPDSWNKVARSGANNDIAVN